MKFRKTIQLGTLILCAISALGQSDILMVGAGRGTIAVCFNTSGYTAADSLGEGVLACGFGVSKCDVPMLQTTGTTEFSIISSPGTPLANTACANSLQMSKAAASSYLTARGMIPTTNLAASGTYDLTGYLYVSVAQPASSTIQVLSMQATGTSTTNAMVKLSNTAGQLALFATDNSVSQSTAVNINASTWYRIDLHGQTGAAGCWIAVSTTDTVGTHQTFTCNTTNTAVTTVILGGGDTSASGTIAYGAWRIKTNSTGTGTDVPTGGPGVYMDFENSTDGTTVTPTILTAGIKSGGIGTWSRTSTSMTVATACEKTLTTPISTAFAGPFNDSGSTRGIKFSLSTSTASTFAYALNTTSSVISQGFWFYTDHFSSNDSTDGFYSFNNISASSGTNDFISTMFHGGLMWLETAANPNGTPDSCVGCVTNGTHTGIPYAASTWYWITAQYKQNGEHSWAMYDASGNLVGSMTKASTATTATTWNFNLGRGGDAGGDATPANIVCTDDVVVDYLHGTWPLTPQ